MLNVRKSGKLVMEMIDFQPNDKFGQDMELLITEIVSYVNEGATNKAILQLEAYKSLHTVIFKRLGMRTRITVDKTLASIMPLYSNQSHVHLESFLRGGLPLKDQVAFMDSVNGKAGTVDTTKAKLGGFFSDFEHSVYINFIKLVKEYKMSPGEITAILFHELGHAFYMCEYSDRLSTGNEVLANVAKEMAKPKTKRNPEYIYKELLSINPGTKKMLVDDIVLGTRLIPGPEAFKYVLETVACQLENNKYDETASENLADNFATRFGYGAMQASALRKIHPGIPDHELMGVSVISLVMSIVVTALVTVMMLLAGSIASALFFAFIGFGLSTLATLWSGESQRDYTYDDMKVRYKRIRNQLVQQIKSKAYNVKDALQLVKQIEYLDDLVNKTGQYRSGVDMVLNYINPRDFRVKTSIERQQLLEDLATNELFIQSLKLQNLATL